MIESVILNSPILILGYGFALFFCIFDLFTHSSGYVMPTISMLLCAATIVYSFFLGAALIEICIAVLIFLIINISAIRGKKGGDK
jgi:TRAP-type C4-dicarboxylate transport system permease small subunit